MPLAPWTRLGPYQVLAPVGAGGMGKVDKASDTRRDSIVAIKTSKEQFSERFKHESAVGSLNHAHLCTLHEVGSNYVVIVPIRKIVAAPLKVLVDWPAELPK